MNSSLQKKLDNLPIKPGVYFYKNASGEIMYVGKAVVLRNRVRQYFQKSRGRDPKTEALEMDITDAIGNNTPQLSCTKWFLPSKCIRMFGS